MQFELCPLRGQTKGLRGYDTYTTLNIIYLLLYGNSQNRRIFDK